MAKTELTAREKDKAVARAVAAQPQKANQLRQVASPTAGHLQQASFGGRTYVFGGRPQAVVPAASPPAKEEDTRTFWQKAWDAIRTDSVFTKEEDTRRRTVVDEYGRKSTIGFDDVQQRRYEALQAELDEATRWLGLATDDLTTGQIQAEIDRVTEEMRTMRKQAGLPDAPLYNGERADKFFSGTGKILAGSYGYATGMLTQGIITSGQGKYALGEGVYDALPPELRQKWDGLQNWQTNLYVTYYGDLSPDLYAQRAAELESFEESVAAFEQEAGAWFETSGAERPVQYQGYSGDYGKETKNGQRTKPMEVKVDLQQDELVRSLYETYAGGGAGSRDAGYQLRSMGYDPNNPPPEMSTAESAEPANAWQDPADAYADRFMKGFGKTEATTQTPESAGGEIIPIVTNPGEEASAPIFEKAEEWTVKGQQDYAEAQYGLTDLGKVLMDVGQQAVFMIPDAVASTVGLGLASMATRVAGQSYGEARRAGYDDETAKAMAFADVIVEVGTEMIGGPFSKLYGKSALGRLTSGVLENPAVKAILSTASEPTEEVIAYVASLAIDHLAGWDDGQGTFWQDLKEGRDEMLYSALVAGIVGGFGATVEGVQGKFDADAADRAIYEALQGGIPELVQEGAESPVGSKANTQARKNQAQLDRGKELTPKQVASQYRANEEQFKAEDRESITQAVTARLTELGETGNKELGSAYTVDTLAKAITKKTMGEHLKMSERRALQVSKHAQQVLSELDPMNVVSGKAGTEWTKGIDTSRFRSDIYTEDPYTDTRSLEDRYLAVVERKRGMDEAAEEERRAVAGRMVGLGMTPPKMSSSLSGGRPTASSTEGGGGRVTMTGVRSGAAPGISISMPESKVPTRVDDLYREGQDEAAFTEAANLAYRAGLTGQSMDSVKIGDNLTPEQRAQAYKRGQEEARAKVEKRNAATKERPKVEGKGTVSGKGIKLADVRKSFNDAQNSAYRFLNAFAKGTGLNIVLYDSSKETGGLAGANGQFDFDEDTIYIDINSGFFADKGKPTDLSRYTMLRTFGHEFVHFMEKWDAEGYDQLRKAVFGYLESKGTSVNDLIDMEMMHGLDEDLASREVVANALADILPQSDFVETLYNQNRTLWEKIVSELKKFIANLKAQFARMQEDERTRAMMDDNLRYAEEIVKLWTETAEKAVAKYQKAQETSDTTLGESGIEADEKSEFGTVYSVKQLLDESTRGKVVKALTDRFGVSRDEATSWINAETSMASIILNPKYSVYLDYEGDPNETAIKMNSDYPQGTVDFSNICKKRREFTQVMNRVLRKFPDHVFAATDLAKIRSIMGEEGMTLPCHICYVEDRRQLDSLVGQDFIDSLKLYRGGSRTRPNGKPFNTQQLKALEMVSKGDYIPSIYELVTLEGRNSLKAKNPDMAAAWEKFNNARGMQSVRLLTNEAEYQRQILKYSPKTVQSKNDHGGLRIYSFSDAEMFHLIDIVQVITDSAAVGLKIQGYTKVNEYAKAVKDTGEKLNRSLIPAGDLGYHMEDGKVVLDYDNVEGIDTTHPDFFDSKDNPDVGNILIGINPTQIRAAMTSDFVDYIIPFHTGQSAEVLKEKKIGAWKNYKDSQSERDIATGKKSGHQINIYTEVIQAAEAEGRPIKNKRDFVNKFLEVCRDNGLEPRFSEFLNTDAAGNYVYTEGYHKFLVDFKMFAQTEEGEYLPQMPVKPVFDDAYISKILKDYVKEQRQKDADIAKQMPNVVERISNEIINPRQAEGDVESLRQKSVKRIVGDSGKDYGEGVYLDSELLTNLTDAERIEMVKEYVKEIGGSTFSAYDQTGNEVLITIAKAGQRFKNSRGKSVAVNRDLVTKYREDKTKQEAIVLIDELISTSKHSGSESARHPHGWLDDSGKNAWNKWVTYLEDKNNTIWEATLNVATSSNGEKYLYDIGPIKKVEQSGNSDTSTTANIVPQPEAESNTEFNQNSRKRDTMSDLEVLELAAKSLPTDKMPEGRKKALEDFSTKLDKLRDLQKRRAELGKQYKEEMFTKGGDREKAKLTHAKMESLDRKIDSATNTLLVMRNKPVFRQILSEARKIIAKEERTKGQEALKAYRARRNESDAKRKYRERVENRAKEILKWLTSPDTKDMRKRVPMAMQESLRDLLTSIDFSSKRALEGKAPTTKDRDFYRKMRAMQEAVAANIKAVGAESGYADIRPEFLEEFEALVKKVDELSEGEGYVINRMSGEELNELSKLLKEVQHYIAKANATVNNSAFSHASEMGDDTIRELGKMGEAGQGNLVERFFTWQNMRPAYVFSRFGKAGESIFEEFRVAQGKQARLTKEVEDFVASVFTPEQAKRFANTSKTFRIGKDDVTIPLTHIMSLYCLSKRPAALTHLLGGGIRVAGVKGETKSDTGHEIDGKKLAEIVATLDSYPEAKAVADKLQAYMSSTLAKWGNEVDMIRFGVPKFLEEFYFPINSDGRHLAATADEKPQMVSLYALLNAGFTKGLQEGADNRLVLYNIFDVFANHAASMIQYSSFALPTLDTLKWFNYKNAEGVSVRDMMAKAFGSSKETRVGSGSKSFAEDFVLNLIKSYNGSNGTYDIYEGMGQKLLQNFNRAQVAFNFRTVVQQPSSIFRAALILPYNQIIKGLGMSAVQMNQLAEEMEKYSGIALWKSMGFYDVNISRGLAEVIKQDGDWRSKLTEVGMKGAELADRYTWAAIWYAAKSEVNRTRYKTEAEYFEAVSKLFEEVIYKTQVVDSVLSKAETQRATGFFAKGAMSFMSEATATVSMLADAYMRYSLDARKHGHQKAWMANRGNLGKVLMVYAVTAFMGAAAQSLADAWRDDDDYEDFFEKYKEALQGNLKTELGPLSVVRKIPMMDDVISLLVDGYEPTSTWAQALTYLKKGAGILIDKARGEESGYTWWGGIFNTLRGLGGLGGVAAAPLAREVVDIWNNTVGRFRKDWKLKTYEESTTSQIRSAFENGFIDREEAIKLLQEDNGNAEMNATFTVDEWAMLNETGIAFDEMQEAYVDGRLTDEEVRDYLVRFGHEKERDAAEKQMEWKMEIDTGIRYTGLKDAYMNGEVSASNAVKYQMEYGGKTQEDAEAKILHWEAEMRYGINVGSSTEGIKTALVEGFITPEEAKHIMMSYDGQTAEKAEIYVNQYLFTKETGYDFGDMGEAYVNGDVSYSEMVDWYQRGHIYAEGDRAEAELYAQVTQWQYTVPGAENFTKTLVEKWNDYGYNITDAGLGKEDFAWAATLYSEAKSTDDLEKGEVFYRELYNLYLLGEISYYEMIAYARSFYSDKYYRRYKRGLW